MKQPVSFRGLDDSAHAGIEQQIGELAAHHLKLDLHPFSTELVSLRAHVESDTLCTGDAYRVKLRVVLSATTRAAEVEAEHVTAALKTAVGELERQLERQTSHLLMMDSCRRKARRDSPGRLKTVAAGTPEESARVREHPGISIEEGTLSASCCRSRTTKQCAADATEDDGFRLRLAAPLHSFGHQTKSARRSADFRILAIGRNAQGRRRAARQRRRTARGSERA
ncbi:hypothetical protein B0G69_7486 [Paraburkholderia sp. RAU2J]|uniref:hypothetical protein n=1 Tax=Paraburkholderia sp. RAU2J TaxID=1938810 RepID=UPI000EB509EF|nr:hypothetical protein [Paraburkholderia sp. RAU2J]RKT14250.1 hypothetical protein B0G69_7486 [Paraburkholderia sp. RAU2J]